MPFHCTSVRHAIFDYAGILRRWCGLIFARGRQIIAFWGNVAISKDTNWSKGLLGLSTWRTSLPNRLWVFTGYECGLRKFVNYSWRIGNNSVGNEVSSRVNNVECGSP